MLFILQIVNGQLMDPMVVVVEGSASTGDAKTQCLLSFLDPLHLQSECPSTYHSSLKFEIQNDVFLFFFKKLRSALMSIELNIIERCLKFKYLTSRIKTGLNQNGRASSQIEVRTEFKPILLSLQNLICLSYTSFMKGFQLFMSKDENR